MAEGVPTEIYGVPAQTILASQANRYVREDPRPEDAPNGGRFA